MPKTVTDKQLVANQKNAKAGGVKTTEGKLISRMNSLKHGFFYRGDFLDDEEQKTYNAILDSLTEQYPPNGTLAFYLLSQIAKSMVKIARLDQFESGFHRERERNMEKAEQHLLFHLYGKETIEEYPVAQQEVVPKKRGNHLTDEQIEDLTKIIKKKIGMDDSRENHSLVNAWNSNCGQLQRIQEYRMSLENSLYKNWDMFMKQKLFQKNFS